MSDSVRTEPALSMGERMRAAFDGIDMKTALSLTFGKCPVCGERLVRGNWLRWCPERMCTGYVGSLNRALGNKIETIMPQSDEEREQLKRLATEFEVKTS